MMTSGGCWPTFSSPRTGRHCKFKCSPLLVRRNLTDGSSRLVQGPPLVFCSSRTPLETVASCFLDILCLGTTGLREEERTRQAKARRRSRRPVFPRSSRNKIAGLRRSAPSCSCNDAASRLSALPRRLRTSADCKLSHLFNCAMLAYPQHVRATLRSLSAKNDVLHRLAGQRPLQVCKSESLPLVTFSIPAPAANSCTAAVSAHRPVFSLSRTVPSAQPTSSRTVLLHVRHPLLDYAQPHARR